MGQVDSETCDSCRQARDLPRPRTDAEIRINQSNADAKIERLEISLPVVELAPNIQLTLREADAVASLIVSILRAYGHEAHSKRFE